MTTLSDRLYAAASDRVPLMPSELRALAHRALRLELAVAELEHAEKVEPRRWFANNGAVRVDFVTGQVLVFPGVGR